MKLTIESTSKIVHVNGVPARIWEGHTASGIPVHCYITRVAVNKRENCMEFERELQDTRPPSPELEGISLRMVL
ncbi:MAG: hypothetical protein ABFD89_29425 [Bryobacteraceae bacterium]